MFVCVCVCVHARARVWCVCARARVARVWCMRGRVCASRGWMRIRACVCVRARARVPIRPPLVCVSIPPLSLFCLCVGADVTWEVPIDKRRWASLFVHKRKVGYFFSVLGPAG